MCCIQPLRNPVRTTNRFAIQYGGATTGRMFAPTLGSVGKACTLEKLTKQTGFMLAQHLVQPERTTYIRSWDRHVGRWCTTCGMTRYAACAADRPVLWQVSKTQADNKLWIPTLQHNNACLRSEVGYPLSIYLYGTKGECGQTQYPAATSVVQNSLSLDIIFKPRAAPEGTRTRERYDGSRISRVSLREWLVPHPNVD